MRSIKTKKSQKPTRLALTLAIALLFPIGASAQGLFRRGIADEEYYSFSGSVNKHGTFNNRDMQTTSVIDNQTFGQELPLGNGIIILIAASAGYAALRRKEEKS